MKLSVGESNVCFHGYDNSKFWNVAMMKKNSIDLAFQQYYRPLCLYALHYLHDLDGVEDVVQDCFVRLLESGKYDALCQQSSESHSLANQLKSFLYASVRNACIDRLRRKNPVLQDVSPSDLQGLITDEQARRHDLSRNSRRVRAFREDSGTSDFQSSQNLERQKRRVVLCFLVLCLMIQPC